MDKASLRLQMVSKRNKLSKSQVSRLSSIICSKIIDIPALNDSNSVGLYLPFRNEVDVERLFGALSINGKKLYAPVIRKDEEMKFARLNSIAETEPGFKGIREPISGEFVGEEKIDVFVVPGLAFDLRGFRLGSGGGHYDRIFPLCPDAVKIGVAYDFQVVEMIENETHDVKMDFVVTEKRVLEV